MKQRPILIAVIGYIIGILVGLYLQKSMVPFYVLIAVIFYLYKIFSQKIFTQRSQKFKLLSIKRYFRYVKLNFNSSVILILIISSTFSNSIVIFQNNNYQKIYSKLEENKTLKLEAIVISSKESKKYYDRYILETVYNKQKIKLYINVKGVDLEYGDKIQTTGEYIRPEKQRNYKGFDYSEYLKQLKIYGTIQTTNIKILRKNNANNFLCIVNKISNIIEEKVKNNISEECLSILLGLILGKTDSIEEEIKQNFRNASMSHILAISGMHVSYLLIGIRGLFNKSLGKRKTSIISIVFLIFYMFLTNFSPSITRAGVMSILLLFSKLVYRNNDTYTSLSLALLIILVYNPFLINNLGLQLSFGGVLGIVLLNKNVFELLKIKKFKDAISISISVQLFILPIVLSQSNIFNPYFLISNLLLSIIVGPIVILGFIYIILILINENLGMFLSSLVELSIKILLGISQVGKLPYSKIYIRTPKIYEILIYYILLFSIKEIYKVYHQKGINNTQKRVKNLIALFRYKFNKKKKKYIIYILIVCVSFSLLSFIPQNLRVYFIDVGQGDSTLIVTPKNKTILIDGGGSEFSDFNVGEKTLLPYILDRGFNKLDYIIISHFDSDHCGGLLYVMQEINIKNIIIGKQYENSKNYEKFLELVREKNINLKCVEAGNKVNIEKNLYFDVLWPYSKRMISENAINNNSLVCKLVYKNFSILFTGDIEKIAENEILDMYSNRLYLLKSNILKVAHHGSKTSSIKEFVESVSPQYALIGVGKNNKFGHPSDGTIKNLKDEKIKIYRTDEMGEIFINTNGKIINKLMYKNSNKSK